MSILGSNNSKFQEIKKQASFFLKEKIKTARLALTDVTPAQLLAEEATNANPGGPNTQILKMISQAAFEVDDYWRVVEILHKKLMKFDKINWRVAYKALIVLEHMLTHGPGSVAEEFQSDKDVIKKIGDFQYIDEKGFNWGLKVRSKSERILKLLDNGALLKDERNRARKITRGIQGFGSFCERTSSGQTVEDLFSSSKDGGFSLVSHENSLQPNKKMQNIYCDENTENVSVRSNLQENKAPEEEILARDLDEWNCTEESNSLLDEKTVNSKMIISREEEDHPFSESENHSNTSLLSAPERSALEAC